MGKGWHRGSRRRGLWVQPLGSEMRLKFCCSAAAGAAAAPTGVVIMSPARMGGRWRRRRHPPHQHGGGSPQVVEGLLVPQGQLIRQQEAQFY